ncbi:unnamed protein product [Ostreobium quekettii]|uniref:PH domain-containing protein n=1 Tax=Ostreobium quekettii TaxID=121088 RepID=A0A8S1INZ5_9CHLO|nr:unnamed protein product [Ostreobium quekettii]
MWMGHFKRWNRRFFSLDTPGALTYSKAPDAIGRQRRTITLAGADVVMAKGNARQFCVVTRGGGMVYLRAMARGDRELWVTSLRKSVEDFGVMLGRVAEAAAGPGLPGSGIHRRSFSMELAADVDPQQARIQRELNSRLRGRMARLSPVEAEVRRRLAVTGRGSGGEGGGREEGGKSGADGHGLVYWGQNGNLGQGVGEERSRAGFWTLGGRKGQGQGEAGIAGRPSAESEERDWDGVDVLGGLDALMGEVRRIVADELLRVLELQVENAALQRRLRLAREAGGQGAESTVGVGSGNGDCEGGTDSDGSGAGLGGLACSSECYSTAGSCWSDGCASEGGGGGIGGPPSPGGVMPDELIKALEVVREVEYAMKAPPAVLVVGKLGEPPSTEEEMDGPEEHNEEDTEADDSPRGWPGPRSCLPAPRPLRRGFSLWSILKNAIGWDLTRITMPSTINEPLSALQRLAEELEYSAILDRAAACATGVDRLLHVSAFVLSSYSSMLLRDSKPFNPLLGETFEYSRGGVRFLAEQVSHHPPVSCFWARGGDPNGGSEEGFELHGELELRSKFWGKSVAVMSAGRLQLRLCGSGDEFVWDKAAVSINNIILGKLWLDVHGDVCVENRATGESARLHLPRCRGSLAERGRVQGFVHDARGEKVYRIYGSFMGSVMAERVGAGDGDIREAIELFRRAAPPDEGGAQYYMTGLAITLNDPREMAPGEVPRTDSRLRPDVRALENGDPDLATSEKLRLEEKQRAARKARKEAGIGHVPAWFRRREGSGAELVRGVGHSGPPVWEFNGGYWERKQDREWPECPDIY